MYLLLSLQILLINDKFYKVSLQAIISIRNNELTSTLQLRTDNKPSGNYLYIYNNIQNKISKVNLLIGKQASSNNCKLFQKVSTVS